MILYLWCLLPMQAYSAATPSTGFLDVHRETFKKSADVYDEFIVAPTMRMCSDSRGSSAYFFYRTLQNTIVEGKLCITDASQVTTDVAFSADPAEQLRLLAYQHHFWQKAQNEERARILTCLPTAQLMKERGRSIDFKRFADSDKPVIRALFGVCLSRPESGTIPAEFQPMIGLSLVAPVIGLSPRATHRRGLSNGTKQAAAK